MQKKMLVLWILRSRQIEFLLFLLLALTFLPSPILSSNLSCNLSCFYPLLPKSLSTRLSTLKVFCHKTARLIFLKHDLLRNFQWLPFTYGNGFQAFLLFFNESLFNWNLFQEPSVQNRPIWRFPWFT